MEEHHLHEVLRRSTLPLHLKLDEKAQLFDQDEEEGLTDKEKVRLCKRYEFKPFCFGTPCCSSFLVLLSGASLVEATIESNFFCLFLCYQLMYGSRLGMEMEKNCTNC